VPMHISNVQVVCPHCDKPTRVAHQTLEGGEHVRRVRVCRHCGQQLEVAK
jgi:large subunit ribosomal protein L24